MAACISVEAFAERSLGAHDDDERDSLSRAFFQWLNQDHISSKC